MRCAGWTAAAVAAGVAWAPVAFADGEADDRVGRVEEALRAQAQETERLRREFEDYRRAHPAAPRVTQADAQAALDAYLAASPPAATLVAPPAPSGVRWGGYLNFEYRTNEGPERRDVLDLHRLIFAVDADVADRVDFRAEVEFEHGGIGGALDGEVLIEFAEVVFRVCDAFQPKVGAILVPFGRYNLNHDDPINDFTVRPFTARFLVPTGFGQPGIGAEGAFPVGCGHLLTYDVALTNGFEDDFKASKGVRDARTPWDEDNNDDKQLWGRLAFVPSVPCVDRLEVGASGTWGRYDDEGENDLTGFALDFLARAGPFEAKGEWIRYDYERDAADPADAIRGQEGLWLEGAWHFFPAAFQGCRSAFLTDTSLFTLALRWQRMDLDDRSSGAAFEDDLEAWSVGLNYRLTERTVFRVDHTWFLPRVEEDREQFTASFSTYF